MTTYKPFCSLECNRAYSATVAGGGYGHGPNDEPYCLNCGARTEAMGSARRQAAGGRWFVWRGNSQGEPVQPISGPYRTAQEAEQDFPPGGAYPFFALQSGPNTSWPGIPYEARRRTAHRHPTDPPRRRATRRHAATVATRKTAAFDGYEIKRPHRGDWQDTGSTSWQGALEAAKGLIDAAAPSTIVLVRDLSNDSVFVVELSPWAGGSVERIASYEQFYGHPTASRRATRRHAAREYTAWGCTDCAMFVANGEPPLRDPETGLDWSQAEEEAWVQEWANENRGIIWSLGDDEDDFSWRACDLCGTALGGARHEFYGFDHG